VPSTGRALTGSSSPRPAIISAVTERTNSEASAGTGGGSSRVVVTPSGTSIRWRPSSAWSTAAQFFSTTSGPRFPYVFSIASLILAIDSSRGSTPEIAKKQVWRTMLMRPARPTARAIRAASMA
jgi:hypothetical protein